MDIISGSIKSIWSHKHSYASQNNGLLAFISLIVNIFTNRKSSTFTTVGTTSTYNVRIGIDQDEDIFTSLVHMLQSTSMWNPKTRVRL